MPAKQEEKVGSILPLGWLPKTWEEYSKTEGGSQIAVMLGHINPENKADPKLLNPGVLPESPGGNVYAAGVRTTKGTMSKFFETMSESAATGFMRGWTPEKVQDLRKQFNAVTPERFDYTANVTVVRYPDRKTALQALESQYVTLSQGLLEAPIPGMPEGYSLKDVFKDERVKSYVNPADFEKITKEIEKASAQMKESFAKSGMNLEKAKFLGEDAVYMKDQSGKKYCQAVAVKNYIVSGSLLYSAGAFPPGSTFCQSLTRFKTKTYVEKVEGKTYTRKEMVPEDSVYAKDGYLNREEAEGIFSSIFSSINKIKVSSKK
ncbi:MAG: hypothetical protein NTU61_02110 [Candidatus Altiarchaeota archaeon]|nr:hypothetical protein [Candidatus Altiarchaeota archaeon]